MEHLCKLLLFILVLMAVLHNSFGEKKGFWGKNTSSKKPSVNPSQRSKTQPTRQPSYPGAGNNPGYPNQQYPGRGGSNPGGYPNQNHGAGSYPAGGSYPSAGRSPNQYPSRGGYNPGGYPNQNPGAGSYPAGGSYPSAGGNPSQYPGRGKSNPGRYPNQNPGAGTYPAGGSPSQYPGRGGASPGRYPNQNPGAGGFSNQYPGGSRYSPSGYPAGGSYPVRTAGQPGRYPGGQPSVGGGIPNWNPNNRILSPRYGSSYGGGGFGMGGSPFSQTVEGMGYGPSVQSKGFGKKAMVAVGVGAMAGMAVGYGIGNFPRPNFQFRSPQEEHQYNNYMYQQQGTHSKGKNNKGGPRYTPGTKLAPKAQSYDQFMNTCMKRKDLLKEQNMKESAVHNNIQRDDLGMNEGFLEKGEPEKNDTTDYPKKAGIYKNEDDDTVSIEHIGYPALIEQMKARKCVELYLVYSESFPEKEEKKSNPNKSSSNHNGHRVSGVLLFLITSIMLLRST